ncbi:MAG: hypothetical protein ACO1RX_03525 [Candidatus Sericytochromatia bacterium]
MGEINKINPNSAFEVRIAQPGPERQDQRDTTVNDQDSSKSKQEPPKRQPKQSEAQERQSHAMEDMLEALRRQHNLEEDMAEYADQRKERYRQSNLKASEDYIKNLKDIDKKQTKEVVEERKDENQVFQKYTERVKDISSNHIQKLLKQRLEDGVFKDLKRTTLQPGETDTDTPAPPLQTGKRLDSSRLRPELNQLLEGRARETRPEDEALVLPSEPHQEGSEEGRGLLENAIQRLKNRLGGAHKSGATAQAPLFSTDVPGISPGATRTPGPGGDPLPIRTNLQQVQTSMQRAQSLKAAADGSQFVPLEDADVQKILIDNKLPVDYATVQAIKVANRKLQDTSYHFQRAVAILSHTGLGVDPESAEIVTDALRAYEKYQRPSIMSKLYRYLSSRKYMQVYQQLRIQEERQSSGARQDLGESLMNRGDGQRAMPMGPRQLYPTAGLQQLRDVQAGAKVENMLLPEDVEESALKGSIQHQLKELGLPASKVMVNQLLQSAQGDPIRAQALVLQLASRRSLQPDEVSRLQQRLAGFSPAERARPLPELMEKLGLPVPERARSAAPASTPAPGSAAASVPAGPPVAHAEQIDLLIQRLGLPPVSESQQPLTREALLLLRTLGERTGTLQDMLPRLADLVRSNPERWVSKLAEQVPALRTLVAAVPESLLMQPEQRQTLLQAVLLMLQLPPDRKRALARLTNMLEQVRAEQPKGAAPAASAAPTGAQPAAAQPAAAQPAAAQPAAGQPAAAQPAAGQPAAAQPAAGQPAAAQPAAAQPAAAQPAAAQPAAAQPAAAQPAAAQPAAAQPAAAQPAAGQPALQHPLQSVIGDPVEVLKAYAWPARLESRFPQAREALLLLHLQAERSDTLQAFMGSVNPLLQQQPEAVLRQLERFLPALQAWSQTAEAKPETLQVLMRQLELAARPERAASGPASAWEAPYPTPNNALEGVLQRFYPEISLAGKVAVQQQLQGGSPALLEGFYQLHRLMGLLDGNKSHGLAMVWEQPQTYARLAQLGPLLSPVLSALSRSPERSYLLPGSTQNQVIQGLQTWLMQGRSEGLQGALQSLLEPPLTWRSPLSKVKEQLSQLGLVQPPDSLLEEVFALSEGAPDRIDAMGLLLRGGFPLVPRNISTMMQYMGALPPQWRRQSAAEILLYLSPQLATLVQPEQAPAGRLGQLGALLEQGLPLLPENWSRAVSGRRQPVWAGDPPLAELATRLLTLAEGADPSRRQDLQALARLLQGLERQLQQLSQQEPARLGTLAKNLQELADTFPSSAARRGQSQIQAWTQLIQTVSDRSQPALITQLQDQVSGVFHQVRTLLPKVQERLSLESDTLTPQLERLAETGLPPAPDLLSMQAHLRTWGLDVQNQTLLQQIHQLMQNDPDRLDAMAILLKGQLPLVPAHIGVVAKYVRDLPPQERFRSISQILYYLSDDLIGHMKTEMRRQNRHQLGEWLPDLPEEQLEQAEALLGRSSGPLTETRTQAARLLLQGGLPQEPGSLPLVQHLLVSRHAPQQWLNPLQQLLGQLSSLLPPEQAAPEIQQALETVQALQTLLQPRSSQLGSWMSGVAGQIGQLSERLRHQINSLTRQSVADPGESGDWLESLLDALLGLSDWVAEHEPAKAGQARQLRANAQQQLKTLRQSVDALNYFQAADAAAPSGAPPNPVQYIPALIQHLGYPVEILVRPDGEADNPASEGRSEVELAVQTHTLGQLHLSLRFSRDQLSVRVGLESRELQTWVQPYLDALQHKLEPLPWRLQHVQTYLMGPHQRQTAVLGRQLQTRYGHGAIGRL